MPESPVLRRVLVASSRWSRWSRWSRRRVGRVQVPRPLAARMLLAAARLGLTRTRCSRRAALCVLARAPWRMIPTGPAERQNTTSSTGMRNSATSGALNMKRSERE